MPHHAVTDFQRGNAKRLRRDMTDAERAVWHAVRARRFDDFRFRRQVPIGPYIVDFLCAKHRVIVEIDGGQHGSDGGLSRDAERTGWLEAQGYRVLRFWNNDVLTNLEGVMTSLLAELTPLPDSQSILEADRGNPASPSKGEGEVVSRGLEVMQRDEASAAFVPSPLGGEGQGEG